MKRAATVLAFLSITGLLLSCGSGYTNTVRSIGSVKVQTYVTNVTGGVINVIDASDDTQPFISIPTNSSSSLLGGLGLSPTFMVLSADKKTTLVYDSGETGVSLVDNTNQTQAAKMHLPDWTESMVISPDAKKAWAAVRNATASGQPTPGAIQVMDLVNGVLQPAVPLPLVHFLALNHAGTKLLAFSDLSDSVFVMDTTSNAITPIAGFNRPLGAVFSSDDSKAYVLNCGSECGGSAAANVRLLDMTTATPTPGAVSSAAVPATTALLNGNSLLVAGTAPGTGGKLSIIDATTLNVTKSVDIGDGFHTLMALTGNNKLFVGARNCTNNPNVNNSGCLSIVDINAQTVTVPAPNCNVTSEQILTCGDVTGIQPITGRNVVYVAQGGELVIYDATTDKLSPAQIDIVGHVGDVKLLQ